MVIRIVRCVPMYLSVLFASVLSLAGCAAEAGRPGGAGNPFDAQASMAESNGYHYLPVHDKPPERPELLMSPEEVARIRRELSTVRGLVARRVTERP